MNGEDLDEVLRRELLRRRDLDQAVREAVPPAERWPDIPNDVVRAVNVDNTSFMQRVVGEHGWPGRDLVGEDGAEAAWLLVQHADHVPGFQRRCLPLLRDAVASGQADPVELAYLTDRVRIGEGRPQVYGTQYMRSPDGPVPHPVEDPGGLDARRAQVGLGPHSVYDRAMRRQDGATMPGEG